MPRIERLRIYPVKALDAHPVDEMQITDAGTPAGDREYAMCDPAVDRFDDPETITRHAFNGKQTDRVHSLDTAFDPGTRTLTVESPDRDAVAFDLPADTSEASAWLGDYLGMAVDLRHRSPPGFVDRPGLGPSVVSTATLETVASWFDGMTVESARRRMRANVEVGGVPPFWEDRFVGPDAPTFAAGGVEFVGAEPCARCVVPRRDPETGDPVPEFERRFVRRREETFPDWADEAAFPHYYTLMLITRVPDHARATTIRVGDEITTRA
jgi:hypothetical protein